MVKSRLPSQNPMVKLLVDVYRSKFLIVILLLGHFYANRIIMVI